MVDIAEEITLEEFRRDIRRQKGEIEIEKPSENESWRSHPEAISRVEYNNLTDHGRHPLDRPRPVWLSDKNRWTVGPPVNPVEWQVLIRSRPTRAQPRKSVSRIRACEAIKQTCGQFQISDYRFSECVDRLEEKNLLKYRGGLRSSGIVVKWLFPDLTGRRAGGEWHRKSIRGYIDEISILFGCYTYADRGFYAGVGMPDVITVRPRLVQRGDRYDSRVEPTWDLENPIYAEFKSATDMRNNPSRLEKQLDRYGDVPLYLEVGARVGEAKNMLKDRGKKVVGFLDLLKRAEGDMVYLTGGERPRAESSFEPVLEKVRDAFLETYDRKARLKKAGADPEGRKYHDLVLYDSLGASKDVGEVIPRYADDVEDFADLYFDKKHLGRVNTADYIYVPDRKPTPENKTWRWEKRKTKGLKFRSFSV